MATNLHCYFYNLDLQSVANLPGTLTTNRRWLHTGYNTGDLDSRDESQMNNNLFLMSQFPKYYTVYLYLLRKQFCFV